MSRPHVMIDLETLSTDAGGMILSIGAVKFDPRDTRANISTFHVGIDIQSSQDAGMSISAGTLMWWFDPARDAARKEWLALRRIPLALALSEFSLWFGQGSLPTWGNGVRMDNAMLEAAYKAKGTVCPWEFYDERCYRTLKNMATDIKLARSGTHHNGLDDALTQARHLQAIVAAHPTLTL